MSEQHSDTMATNFTFNCIHIVESFKGGELRKGKEIYEDILRWEEMKNPGFHAYYHDVSSADDLYACLDKVEEAARSSEALPIIHFEAHGDVDGLQMKNGDFVKWLDIKDKLTNINIATRNNLLITLGSCKGAYIIDIMKPHQITPMFGFIVFLHDISFDVSRHAFSSFYKDILYKKSFDYFVANHGFGQHAAPDKPLFFSCVYLFMVVFERYTREYYKDTGDIVSRVMKVCNDAKNENLTNIRVDEIAAQIVDVESQFNRYKAKFLMIDLFRENLTRFPQQFADINRLATN